MTKCSPVITSNTEMPGAVGRALGVAGQAHQAGHGLDEEVVAGQVLLGRGAEAADGAVDAAWVAGRDRLVVQAEASQAPGLEVLDEHVRAL